MNTNYVNLTKTTVSLQNIENQRYRATISSHHWLMFSANCNFTQPPCITTTTSTPENRDQSFVRCCFANIKLKELFRLNLPYSAKKLVKFELSEMKTKQNISTITTFRDHQRRQEQISMQHHTTTTALKNIFSTNTFGPYQAFCVCNFKQKQAKNS